MKLTRRQLFGAVIGAALGAPADPVGYVSRVAVRDRILGGYHRMLQEGLITRARGGKFSMDSVFAGKGHLSRRLL